jgi:hypothetical protein
VGRGRMWPVPCMLPQQWQTRPGPRGMHVPCAVRGVCDNPVTASIPVAAVVVSPISGVSIRKTHTSTTAVRPSLTRRRQYSIDTLKTARSTLAPKPAEKATATATAHPHHRQQLPQPFQPPMRPARPPSPWTWSSPAEAAPRPSAAATYSSTSPAAAHPRPSH